MKYLHLLLVTFFVHLLATSLIAQNGPGGIGNSTDNILWLDASELSLSDGDPVSTWSDLSGNSNNATQGTASRQPTFTSNSLNGFPVVTFDGTDLLNLTSHITNAEITAFNVFKGNNGGGKVILELEKHQLLGRNVTAYVQYGSRFAVSKSSSNSSIYSLTSEAAESSNFLMTCDNNSQTYSRTSFHSSPTSTIGGSTYRLNNSISGFIPEIILYNRALNSSERNIVINYLASKYNRVALNDLYSYESEGHYRSLIGIGQESDGSNLTAIDRDSVVKIFNPSSMSNGDYLLIASDNGDLNTSSDVPIGYSERWNKVWRADKTGSPGTVDIEFFLGSSGFSSPSNYVIVIENADGDFSNGGTSIHTTGRSYQAGSNSMVFTDVDLSDGAYFTLAEAEGDISSIASGSWEEPSNWSCNCIPDTNDIVNIVSPHVISVDSNANVTDLTIENGATLDFDGFDTLNVHRDLTFDAGSSFDQNIGTIAAISSTSTQNFANNSANRINLHNLFVANSNGLNLSSGGWSIRNNLQVSSGGMNVTAADSIVLISDASATSQILESMNGAFTGDFIVQRYIGTRNANYGNLGSPVENATIADLDDDLYLSGVNGNDGNARASDGSTFYSIWTYYSNNGQDGSMQSTTEPLYPGQGYEIYLADNLSTFNATIIDYIGTPNTGELDSYMLTKSGWNLFANQFHAHVAYDSVDKSIWIPDEYYIFNTDNGSYDLISGNGKPLLAPGQGFWIATNGSGKAFEFKEEDKVASTSSTFLRQKEGSSNKFNFTISNNENPFKHRMEIDLSPFSISEIDEEDALFLESPIEEAPAIFSFASNSEAKLIKNSLNVNEPFHLIPISIDAGVNGNYNIESKNLEKIQESYSCIYLKDKESGEVIDLSVEDSYSFEANKGKSDRFNLILSNSYQECEKMIKNGGFEQELEHNLSLRNVYDQWYLDYTFGENLTQVEIRIFNMNGQEVLSPLSFSASDAGSYPIHGLQELEGIFMIQVKSKDEIVNKTVKL